MSGEAMQRGWPPLSPVKEGSKAMVRKPRSAMVWAYRPAACSLDRAKGAADGDGGQFAGGVLRRVEVGGERDAIAVVEGDFAMVYPVAPGKGLVPFLGEGEFFFHIKNLHFWFRRFAGHRAGGRGSRSCTARRGVFPAAQPCGARAGGAVPRVPPACSKAKKRSMRGRVAAGVQQVAAKLEYAAFGHGRHVHPSRTSPLYPA